MILVLNWLWDVAVQQTATVLNLITNGSWQLFPSPFVYAILGQTTNSKKNLQLEQEVCDLLCDAVFFINLTMPQPVAY